MRTFPLAAAVLIAGPIAGCADHAPAGQPAGQPAGMRPDAAGACRIAVAEHLGLPPAVLDVEPGADGSFVVRDGNRQHICRLDARGRVTALEHPQE